jgi:large subunit ribosomal protein L9
MFYSRQYRFPRIEARTEQEWDDSAASVDPLSFTRRTNRRSISIDGATVRSRKRESTREQARAASSCSDPQGPREQEQPVKVVFLEDVPGTAKIGDIKEVKPGFARNYLLPRKLAAAATPNIVKSAEQRAVRETRLQEARDTDARAVAGRLEAQAFTLTARAGASGKLFGSVGTADIAAKVAEAIGDEFDRHNVVLRDPIKDLGDYQVPVKLTKNVNATLNVSVVGEDGTTAADIRARAEAGAPAQENEAPAAATDDDDETEDDQESEDNEA